MSQKRNSKFPLHLYEKVEPSLGAGAFAEVFRLQAKDDYMRKLLRPVAAKIIHPHIEKRIKDALDKEIRVMEHLDHPNLVQYLGTVEIDQRESILMELCHSDLNRLIAAGHRFTEYEISVILTQICKGVEYLHAKNIIHR